MVEVGEVLEFKEPIHEFHRKDLEKGGYYSTWQTNKQKIYQTEDGVWHVEDLPELEPMRVCLKTRNGFLDCGELSQYKDYKVVGKKGEF